MNIIGKTISSALAGAQGPIEAGTGLFTKITEELTGGAAISPEELCTRINRAVTEAQTRLAAAADADEVEAVRIALMGRNGLFQALSKVIADVPKEAKREVGKAFNCGRAQAQKWLDEAGLRIERAADASESIDVTLPGRMRTVGHKHPINIIVDDCVEIFRRMGFVVASGPEIETVRNNFDQLNTPADHPSRDRGDTFYFADGRILRTQTSPVQIRTMESHEPPVRIVAPGRVFRRDTPDATHGMNFHQIEGLYIDRNVSMADLKSVLQSFAWEMYGKEVKIRLRPHFFPFTEPSVEYDFSCMMCKGKGCPVCKQSGYIEIAGAGMVDPNVLRNVGYDPAIWSGFAFGMGIERLAMLRYRIGDIRYLYENDVRFLEQF
ncbi:MAG: phenylalanine--tRNA ligase subunit alpha [Victivallaceae bacterium]|nr:phenylalanine--tRNA ligase subunit alpha [Victivallaceae bacterium]